MAAPAGQAVPVNADTLIAVKVTIDGSTRRFKLALRDLGASTFPQKLRFLLAIPPDVDVIFERYSDSAAAFVTLDSSKPSVYKQLYRAAKAKLKLRIKATLIRDDNAASGSADEPRDAVSPSPAAEPQHNAFSGSNPSATTLAADDEEKPRSFSHAQPADFDPAVAACYSPMQQALRSLCQPTYALSSHSRSSLLRDVLAAGTFCIDCNNCNLSIANGHYHCSICDDGDFDLCQGCVDAGVLCHGEGHWLIKRFIENGKVINSTTETIAPKRANDAKPKVEADPFPVPTEKEEVPAAGMERTCNSCIGVFPESDFVTCTDCPDYDLCMPCHRKDQHGHHPGHTFKPVVDGTPLDKVAMSLCKPGRGKRHPAICDGCDLYIVGVRNKCLTCPDWDYCSTCIQSAREVHPGHRFVPIYDTIAEPFARLQRHHGIYCDGPLCSGKAVKSYIVGDRYKCSICYDTDFCASCEAIPINRHNRTHPLIKFKTPVRSVAVTTYGEKENGELLPPMGDKPKTKSAATETTPIAVTTNAATQVRTVAEVKPADESVIEEKREEKQEAAVPSTELQAFFVRDTIPDNSKLPPNQLFDQVWTLRNPGPHVWPAGCSVRFIGGDGMLNLDSEHPSSVSAIADATESNVIGHEVLVNEAVDFRVTLKTPKREGKAISYWRLKAADGTPFGHKLWCDIDVCKPAPSEVPETQHVEDIKEEKSDERVAVPGEETVKLEGSTMIFPKLEKESPVSSTHEAQPSAPMSEAAPHEDQELLDDLESLEVDDGETDDGFLTDEEYDVLDASDEEFLMEAQKAAQK